MNQIYVPSKMKYLINGKVFTEDTIGMSGSQILLFEDTVLKIENTSSSMQEQVQMMEWLKGKIPVPQVIAYEEEKGKSYLLMSKIQGEMSCSTYYLERPHILVEALAYGLKMLWQVDIKECPCIRDLNVVLKEARVRVENDLVDLDNVESTTFGKDVKVQNIC